MSGLLVPHELARTYSPLLPGGMGSKLRTSSSPLSDSSQRSQSLFVLLIAFRLLNALTVRTFFQPDEYFQSLEPAWAMVFSGESGAWITWVLGRRKSWHSTHLWLISVQEWRHRLRSSIHPTIFAIAYYLASMVADMLQLSSTSRANILVAMPKVLQAFSAALGDYYTWKLGRRVYGSNSLVQWVVVGIKMSVRLHIYDDDDTNSCLGI